MSSQGFNCGQCCAGEFCTNEHRQLRPDVTCTTCGKILHLLCGIGGQEEDTFECKICYDQKQKEEKSKQRRESDKRHRDNESEERKKVRREKIVFVMLIDVKKNQKKVKIRDEKKIKLINQKDEQKKVLREDQKGYRQ